MTAPVLPTHGVQQPILEVHPPFFSSMGDDAVSFNREIVGLDLYPWQEHALSTSLNRTREGKWAAPTVGLVVPRQNGKGSVLEAREMFGLFVLKERKIVHTAHEFKALDVETPILAERGWTTMGELVDGDRVYGPDGELTNVIAHPVRYGRPCFRVTFDDGQSVVADEDHLWGVTYRESPTKAGRYVVRSTRELFEHGVVSEFYASKRKLRHFTVQVPEPLELPERDVLVDPWLLGFWLGDGSSGKAELTVCAQDRDMVLARLDALGYSYTERESRGACTAVYVRELLPALRALGVVGNKHVPEDYMLASVSQRRALLAGLLDSDGTVTSNRQVSFASADRALAEQVLSLVRSLGYKASSFSFEAKIGGKSYGDAWRVVWRPTRADSPFSPGRHTDRLPKSRGRESTRGCYNAIVAIEPVVSRPTRCITVDNESRLYCVGRGFVPTHNTATEHLTRLRSLIEPNPELMKMVRTIKTGNSDPGIYMKDGERQLRMLARSGGSGRGFSGDLIVLDEAYAVSSAMMEALRPTMATRSNYQLWYASSAGFAYSTELKALRESAKAGDSKRLAYLEWAVDEDDFDPADPRDWARANPTIGYRISWEYMQDEYEAFKKVDNIAGFAREHLGVWEMNAANSKIPEGRWKAARDPRSEIRDDRVTVGLSVNKARRASLSVAGATDDARIQGEVVRNEEAGPWIVQDILALRERWDVLGVVLDASSPAGQWLGALTEAGVEVKALGTRQIAQSDGGFHERVLSGGFVHVGQEVLDQAAMSSAEQPVGGAWCYRLESDLADMTTLKSVAVAVEHFAFVVGGEVKELQEREEMDSWVW